MATVVPSRFACLKIEADDFVTRNPGGSKKKKTAAVKTNDVKKTNSKVTQSKVSIPTVNNKKKNKPKTEPSSEQWEQWKQRDSQMVEGHYEEDLEQAILLSKLEFERAKKDQREIQKKASEQQKAQQPQPAQPVQPAQPTQKKQKKPKTMTLDQFNDMVSGNTNDENDKIADNQNGDSTPQRQPVEEREYFTRVKEEVKTDLKSKHSELHNREPVSDEVITRLQFAEVIEKKNGKIKELKEEVLSLKDELIKVKMRNKKLYSILGHGEMRDKAELLEEVDRLTTVREELTAEVSDLHARLEQERSRAGDARPKEKKKRHLSEKEK